MEAALGFQKPEALPVGLYYTLFGDFESIPKRLGNSKSSTVSAHRYVGAPRTWRSRVPVSRICKAMPGSEVHSKSN